MNYIVFQILAETINDMCKGSKIYYLANPGNLGDALIRHSTLIFFNDFNIPYHEISLDSKKALFNLMLYRKKKTLIYGGGGGWCSNWNIGFPAVKSKLKYFNQAIVLPSTYEKSYLLKNTVFFRRDNYESKINMPNSHFCHDMAFYFNPESININNSEDEAHFFRTDLEGKQLGLKYPNNRDITKDKNQYDDINPFIHEISKYNKIYTDKLHIAILAAKLNKDVEFYSGNYFKNKAVFLSSMKDNFPKVKFIE
ncbi:polysaccharide pyruvyl transferase family protein [Alkalitalea saponilacus]|uniref:Polysaccharide pyruvyl transferase domain-containing protein n=1 Tax=Alkalitalea saponilacus TaxID=889453 RepID=A0A1T5H0B6_9BACT|nr:polysaccharide pyruvyl transferase family protein [Alkalitalea saponilacus]ASB50959.1 hypothetical protein CDL62_18305 [Alkalitalea saponilacus]SKC13970.1 hypothetical protein SAMN03080601_02003 [Alkalitalea saponilacus]